jgi:hypothetical protein
LILSRENNSLRTTGQAITEVPGFFNFSIGNLVLWAGSEKTGSALKVLTKESGVRIQETEERMRLRRSLYKKAWWSEATSFVILISDFWLLNSLAQLKHSIAPSRGNPMQGTPALDLYSFRFK